MKIFTVLDTKSEYFLRPMVETSTAQAVRAFTIAANEKNTPFNMFPDDFVLMELADFDVQSGKITPREVPHNLGTARSFLNSVTQ